MSIEFPSREGRGLSFILCSEAGLPQTGKNRKLFSVIDLQSVQCVCLLLGPNSADLPTVHLFTVAADCHVSDRGIEGF